MGMVEFLGIMFVMAPPAVSMPNESGATSINKIDCICLLRSPLNMAACTAAPYATASSGLMLLFSSLPLKKFSSNRWILGIRVEPPTSTTSSMSLFFSRASLNARSTGTRVDLNKSMFNSSNRARLIFVWKSIPSNKLSISMAASAELDKVRFALSHAVL